MFETLGTDMKIFIVIIGLALSVFKFFVKSGISMQLFHRDAYEKTFVCPNCGARFNVEWYRMIYKVTAVYAYKAARLKCPVCHKRDMCSIAHDE